MAIWIIRFFSCTVILYHTNAVLSTPFEKLFSLLTAYQILSAELIKNSTWQSWNSKLQYNTCWGRNGMWFSAPTTSFDHVIWSVPDHIVTAAVCQLDHMRQLVCFLAAFRAVLICQISCFEILFYTSKWWPHIIFSDTDLTTFLTIVTSGVHGDKMSGEYEKAVFA